MRNAGRWRAALAAVAVATVLVAVPAGAARAQPEMEAGADTLRAGSTPAAGDTVAVVRTRTDTTVVRTSGTEAAEKGLPPVLSGHTSPTGALVRSLVVPGWGQLANGKRVKAAIVFLGEGSLLAGMVYEKFQADDARQRAREAETEAARLDALAEKDRHLNRRNNYGWWSFAAVLYSIADAYVDAYLAGYDEEWRLRASLEPDAGARLGLTRTF